MSEEPATATEATSADESGGQGPAYLQVVEIEAGPLEAGDAIERTDAYGRVPVVVRIRRQPPINPVWVLIAIGIGASGLFLPLEAALRAIIIVLAVIVLIVGIASRLFMRIPPGTIGLVARAGRHQGTMEAGVHRVSPFLALTHVVTTRELAFDVPVAAVRSADGVNVNVDLVLTLGIGDPVKLVYSITTGDIDQFIHATTQDGVRTLVRGIEALSALDLGAAEASILRTTVDDKLAAYGVNVRAVAFTRVLLPEALTASLEARRLAVIQLAEEHENFVLEQRRVGDRASLIEQEQEARKVAIEIEAGAEALRLSKLEERLGAYPTAARYDLEMARLRVAQQLAGNTRAVVSLGGNDLVSNLLLTQHASAAEAGSGNGSGGNAGAAESPSVPAPKAKA